MPEETMQRPTGSVYTQTNERENRVIAYGRSDDGALTRLDEFATGGAGDETPHLASQGSVMLCGDDRFLLATNAASDDVAVFYMMERGLERITTAPVGPAPKSVAEHRGLVYVLCTGGPNVVGFRLTEDGLERLDGSERQLSGPDADPAQVGFTADGSMLIVTERGTNSITSFEVGDDGVLGEMHTIPSSGPTPYGFAWTEQGVLVVTEAFGAQKGQAAASSYRVHEGRIEPVTRSVHSGRSEVCWAVATPDGRRVYTTNFADGTISCFAVDTGGTLTLEDAAAGITEEGRPGLRDEDLTADGRFLYALDADAGRIYGWTVGGNGSLEKVGMWNDLPKTVAGLAAR